MLMGSGLVAFALASALKLGSDNIYPASKLYLLPTEPASTPSVKPEPRGELPVKARDPLFYVPRELVTELTAPEPVANETFRRVFLASPATLCAALGRYGISGAKMRHNPVLSDQWNCDSDLVAFGAPADGMLPSSLFVSLRGHRPDKVDYIRLKLNLNQPATAEDVKLAATNALKGLHGMLGWNLPDEVVNAIEQTKDAKASVFGADYNVFREWSETPRLNVIIKTEDSPSLPATDAFEGAISTLRPQPVAPRKPGPARLPPVDSEGILITEDPSAQR